MRTVVLLGCTLLSGVAACTASSSEVRPPSDQFYFPTGLTMAPDESVAFVTNANSELRYDSGSIMVLELDTVDQVVANWIANKTIPSSDCQQDPDHTETLNCQTPGFLRAGAGVRIGNFATDIAAQDLGAGNARLIIPTRGDPSIAWADWDGNKLTCTVGGESNAVCDDTHRLSSIHNDPNLSNIPDEPFGVFADTAGEFAVVTHLSTGAVTLIDSPRVGAVQVADVVIGLFLPDALTGLRAASGVAGRTPQASGDIVYVGSASEDRVQTFTVGRPINNAPPFLLPGDFFFLNAVGGNSGGSNDTRGMAFSPNGERLYLVNRAPPSLQVIDTSIGTTGLPRNVAVGATDICREASTVTVAGLADAERAYVTCFQDGQVYVIDPRGQSKVDDILLVGRGPFGVVASKTRNKLFVTNFLEDTIAVIDLAPASPMRNRVVLRIGEPRAL
jgi:hypothetical protein